MEDHPQKRRPRAGAFVTNHQHELQLHAWFSNGFGVPNANFSTSFGGHHRRFSTSFGGRHTFSQKSYFLDILSPQALFFTHQQMNYEKNRMDWFNLCYWMGSFFPPSSASIRILVFVPKSFWCLFRYALDQIIRFPSITTKAFRYNFWLLILHLFCILNSTVF